MSNAMIAIVVLYLAVSVIVGMYFWLEHDADGEAVFHGLFWPIGLLLSAPEAIKKYWDDLKKMAE